VDDIILTGNEKKRIDRVKQTLNKTLKIKDLGDLRYFLSLKIAKSKKGIMIILLNCVLLEVCLS